MNSTALRLFVYGTLKRGHGNHRRFCQFNWPVTPAIVWGRLYALPAGFPALELPPGAILAHGSADPAHDAQVQAQWPSVPGGRPTGDWDPIAGELITLPDAARYLPAIDRLEDFRPGRRCLYDRVLVTVHTPNEIVPAWMYDGGTLVGQGERIEAWG